MLTRVTAVGVLEDETSVQEDGHIMEYEGESFQSIEDGGSLFFGITSACDDKQHAFFRSLLGKRIRITLEVIEG